MSSSNTVKYPSLPIATMGFTDKQMTDYGLEMLRLNAPVAGLRLDGLLISRGSWDAVRAVQAALLARGVKTEACKLNDSSAPAPSLTFYVDSPTVNRFYIGGTVTHRGGLAAAHNIPRNVTIIMGSTETVTLERKGRDPLVMDAGNVAVLMLGGTLHEATPKPQPFDLKRAQAGDPIQTRDGRAAEFIAYAKNASDSRKVVALPLDNPKDGYMFRYADGRYSLHGARNGNDLVMAPKPKCHVWVNTYTDPKVYNGVVGIMYDSEEKAKEMTKIMPPGAFASVAVRQEIE